MGKRTWACLAVTLLALLAGAAPAFAGGWAIISLDALPADVRAGQTQQIGFTVLQHGVTPTNRDLDGSTLVPVLTITPLDAAAGKAQEFNARPEGATGHFIADVTFPAAGRWAWSIQLPSYMVQTNGTSSKGAEFEPLTVLPLTPAAEPAPAPGMLPAALRWGGVALLVAALGALLLGRRARPVAAGGSERVAG